MIVRFLIGVNLMILLALTCTTVVAQQKSDSVLSQEKDTVILKSSAIDTSVKTVPASDTAAVKKKKFNPKVATIRSAILPGWGQWYNKKYWKIPIVYGALGISAGVFFYNRKTYNQLRQAVIYRLDSDTTNDQLINPEFASLSTESIRMYRNAFRQNIDYSVLAFLVLWGLNVVDATVDAQLKGFNVSPDITMKVRPSINYPGAGGGVSLVFSLRDRYDKPLRPLL